MKRGEHVVVGIETLTPKGDGLAVLDGREILVPRTVPGDRAEVYLRRKRKGRFEGVADDLIEEGMPRHDPGCPHFGLCGGCRWQDLSCGDQLQLKQDMVRQSFDRRELAPLTWYPIAPSPDPFYYRNKMEFSFGTDRDGDLQLGLHVRERYNRVFDLEACLLQSEASNQIVDSFRRHAVRLELPVYDLKSHEGLLRFLVVRDAKGTGQVMVSLVVAEYPAASIDSLLEGVFQDVGELITTCVVTRHTGRAQVAKGEAEFVIKGEGRIVEICGGLEFEVSPQSFFQTNTRAAAGLYDRVVDLLGELHDADVLDLYAGTGGVSLHLAQAARSVVGIEEVGEAVDDARRNAVRNGIDNCTFLVERAESVLGELASEEGERFDAIVADPPRAGIHKKALAGIVALGPPVLIYVSCNAETLADDLFILTQAGYDVITAQPVEMFPHTLHCEVLTSLRRTPRWSGNLAQD
jgi:23S rRNA (uracil1939-C5)-methyltransferase